MENKSNQKSIVGIGSALVDILVQLPDDTLLEQFHLPKGSMTLVDAELSERMMDSTTKLQRSIETGGSAANTVRAIASLGGSTGFIGKLGDDRMGQFFRGSFEELRIYPHFLFSKTPTGKAITLISPDSERTFGTYLGAASEFSVDEISSDIFSGYDFLHIEGYLVFNHKLIEGILKKAKEKGLKISLDMASFNMVESNFDFLNYLVEKYVDIVFANEEEAKAFTGLEPEAALSKMSGQCEIAVVKIGKDGSLIQKGDDFIKVMAIDTKPRDTTGAGDVYAAGFLYGLANHFNIRRCAELGTLLASRVIQVLGAKIPDSDWENIHAQVQEMKS